MGAWLQVRQSGECRCRRHSYRAPATLGRVAGYLQLIYRSNSPFGKKYTFCDQCFLSLFRLKKHRSQNVVFFKRRPIVGKNDFVRFILRVYFGPTWSTIYLFIFICAKNYSTMRKDSKTQSVMTCTDISEKTKPICSQPLDGKAVSPKTLSDI